MNRKQRMVAGLIEIAAGVTTLLTFGSTRPSDWPFRYACHVVRVNSKRARELEGVSNA
jgi:hypothetical protein